MKKLLKAFFSIVPFKRQIFKVLRFFWVPSPNIFQHLYFRGPFTTSLPDGKKFNLYADKLQFENELFWSGITQCWEQTSLPLWIDLCKDADVVFDIGAQSGIFSVITRTVNKNCDIHTFEPTDRFHKHLIKNKKVNNYDFNCQKIAISNVTGTFDVETVWQEDKKVSTITLDDYIEQNGITKIDLLKVDVDFHEIKVAEGFKKYFKKFQPTVLIEVLSDEIAQGIEKHWMTQELGYLVYSISEKAGTIRKMPNMQKRGDNMNFLLCKKEVALKLNLPLT
ncbi:MAG: FkbM family methyltransferase [Saprospiraceae bacterium]